MTDTHVSVLTPPGAAAIAVLAVRGPRAWPAIQGLFRNRKDRPLSAPPRSFAFGRIGQPHGDEVILIPRSNEAFEIHSHGGRKVVAWLVGLFRDQGIGEADGVVDSNFPCPTAGALLPLAKTLRTASILLDQAHGAYDRAVAAGADDALRRNAAVGRHLVEPWTVAIAGAPNAGKSSLLNALAGFQRSIVSPIPGTTRDAVSVTVAVDGWPVELIDTAGIRETTDELEREGVTRAHRATSAADLVLWVVDATADLSGPPGGVARTVVVINKIDLVESPNVPLGAVAVSAAKGTGIAALAARIARELVPHPPEPGDPVPYSPMLASQWH